MFMSYAWAQGATAAQPSFLEANGVPLMVLVFVLFFLIIRPAQKRQKTQQSFMSTLKRGDSVLTTSGILGTIEGLTEQIAILQIADGVKVRMLKSQIASLASVELEKK